MTGLVFDAVLFDGLNYINSKTFEIQSIDTSVFNPILRRYEIILIPELTTPNASLTITSGGVNIYGSTFTVEIVPGPCSLFLNSFQTI